MSFIFLQILKLSTEFVVCYWNCRLNLSTDLSFIGIAEDLKMSITYKGTVESATPASTKKAAVAHDEVKIFNGLNKKEMMVHKVVKDKNKPRFGKFQEDPDKRQESRRSQIHGFVTKMDSLKTFVGDDVMVVIFNSDKQCYSVLSIDG